MQTEHINDKEIIPKLSKKKMGNTLHTQKEKTDI